MKETQSVGEGKKTKKKKKRKWGGWQEGPVKYRNVHETRAGCSSSSAWISSSSLEIQLDFIANELSLPCLLKVKPSRQNQADRDCPDISSHYQLDRQNRVHDAAVRLEVKPFWRWASPALVNDLRSQGQTKQAGWTDRLSSHWEQ